jgi:ABC-type glycerol-3-phosphate transport system substrate-binding protein
MTQAGVTIKDDWTWDEYIEAATKVKEATAPTLL